MEIERKFTVKRLPDDLDGYGYHIIEQAYLTDDPVIRVRREDDKYYMTYKGVGGSNTALAHEEYNLPLTKAAYDFLASKTEGCIIRKKRVLIPYNGYTIELDIFAEPFLPLIIAEVEFASEDEAEGFEAPEWFDKDVTDDPAYRNANLALRQGDGSFVSIF